MKNKNILINEECLNKVLNLVINNFLIKESVDLNSYIPKRFYSSLKKLEDEYKLISQQYGDEFVFLDISSGVESFYKISSFSIKDGILYYNTIYDDYQKTVYDERVNLVNFDEDSNEYYFNSDEAKEFLSYLKKDLKKGIKYFKEYKM